MQSTRIKISSIVESQLPDFVRTEYPLVEELFKEYYSSLDSVGLPYDILSNIDKYVKVDNVADTVESTILSNDVLDTDDEIEVSSTKGFPKTYGLIKINNEIILYKSKTDTTFLDCSRGFSGITKYSSNNVEDLEFSTSLSANHTSEDVVENLSGLILKQFFGKIKKQFLPGFEGRELYGDIKESTFLKQSKDFYNSKGTSKSFEILFRCLYGEDVNVILPKHNLISLSNSEYEITRNFVVTPVQGNPDELINQTIFQDQYQSLRKSFGTISNVEKIIRDGEAFYNLKVDSTDNNPYQNLKIHSTTKTIDKSPIGSDKISVDSTLSFENSGEIIVSFDNKTYTITYTDRTVNQFLNCTGIEEEIPVGANVSINSFAYGFSPSGEEIRFRFNGVISGVNLTEGSQYYKKGDIGRLLSLGYDARTPLENNWIINNSVRCDVKSFVSTGTGISIETFDSHNLNEGDKVDIEYTFSSEGEINSINETHDVISLGASNPKRIFQINPSVAPTNIRKIKFIRRVIHKIESSDFMSDVLNVYKDFNDDDIYVTSSSLPSYKSNTDKDFKYDLGGVFSEVGVGIASTTVLTINNHGLITGDAITYESSNSDAKLGIDTGVYFIKTVDNNNISISRSKSNLFNEKYVSVGTTTTISNEYIQLEKFNKNIPTIDSQRIIRKLSTPKNSNKKFKTLPGTTTGILVNGVEILNYKSNDFVYYGSLERIDVTSTTSGLDIINPPVLEISSASNGLNNAKGACGVEGGLVRIDIIEPGFDYTDTPVISISGGSGSGARTKVQLIDYDYSVKFNASFTNRNINLVSNQIGFSTSHKFTTGEYVVYNTFGSTPIGGLVDNSKYYINVVDDVTITLHKSEEDSFDNKNATNITTFGTGLHSFRSVNKKKKINSITILNSGSGYKNKEVKVASTGINTANNTINTVQHPYQSGEIIFYYGGDTDISGLSTGKYIVTRLNDQSFKLSEVGVGNTKLDYFYDTKQYVNLKTQGSGLHEFNYEKIVVSIDGPTGTAGTFSGNEAVIQPVFRGDLKSISLSDGGVGYGSSEIINFNKQPKITLISGSGAAATPIISNGKIVDVVVYQKGSGYNSPPDIEIIGSGIGALLSPVIENGFLKEIKVINSGINYGKNDTSIKIINPVGQLKLSTSITAKNINLYERLLINESNKLNTEDDGVVYKGRNLEYGLEFTHLYAPKSLRERLFTSNLENTLFRKDIDNDNKNTNFIAYHSPILGWAYDGNPIYGPYGFESIDSKNVIRIKSSYRKTTELSNRSPQSLYPIGFFVEDWVYDPTKTGGDLDENNGRFCVTPEFPQGVYAYFMTINEDFEPEFPYIIGDGYHSDVIDFNLRSSSIQSKFDFSNNIVRNTNLYNSLSFKSNYEYFLNISKTNLQNSIANGVNYGGIDSIKIISPGENYKINDTISFESDSLPPVKALAEVSRLSGREIIKVENVEPKILNKVELFPNVNRKEFIAFSTSPHNLQEGNQVTIDSLSRENFEFQSTFNVNIRKPNELILSKEVDDASTGIATYFNVIGDLTYPNIRENDILEIGSEKVKVLNIDKVSSRIRVLREQETTVSTAHSAYTKLVEDPRKLFVELPKELLNEKYALNRELYFNPVESLGVGTSASTLTFSNPGIGVTSLIIPEKSIFIKNHSLKSGDIIAYKPNTGDPIGVSTDGINDFLLSEDISLYVTKLSDDLIGISSDRVSLTNDGTYVGVGTTAYLLYFNSVGTKTYHSFTTNYENVLSADLNLYKTTVSTATTHSLRVGDTVVMDAKPRTRKTFVVRYNDFNRRLIINPKDFDSVDVDVEQNLIYIENHGYSNGDKVIHNSDNPIGGLNNEQIYYISVFNKNKIKLFNSYYDSINKINQVRITSQFSGSFSQINPRISVARGNIIEFDLSDNSLSESKNGAINSSFDLKFYIDEDLNNELISISNSNQELNFYGFSNIQSIGEIGITSGAKIEFSTNSIVENKIYYDLVPIGESLVKKTIIRDDEVRNNNEISFVDSVLSGEKKIIGIGESSFDFYNSNQDFTGIYLPFNEDFSYTTDSKTEFGPINNTRIISKGSGYELLPYISKINTSSGTNALLIPESDEIGSIISAKIKDIGFNYSSDPTLKPLVKFSTKYRVEPLSNVESIRVLTSGLSYITNPDIILIDSLTKETVDDLILNYQVGNEFVDIVQNTKGIYNIIPEVVVYNNSNGVGISSVFYDPGQKNVRLTLKSIFDTAEEFPFEVNDEIFVEGINIVENIDSVTKGYNSEDYGFNKFKVVDIFPNIGSSGAYVTYTLSDYLSGSENPGTWDFSKTGSVVNAKFLPTFDIKLAKNKFEVDETISNGEIIGVVRDWEPNNEYVTVEVDRDYSIGDLIIADSSKSQGFIREFIKYESFYNVDSSSIVIEGWKDKVGFLNEQEQRIQDSDYYQNFSYALESKVQFETWSNDINNLNHTLGFKKFATYIFDSDIDNIGISTNQNNGLFDPIVDRFEVIDVECIRDFDLVSENSFYVNKTLNSDEIIFNSKILLDYAQSIGNRALILDDISDQFNSQISQIFVTSFNI